MKFMCIKDFVMQDGDVAFLRGKFYEFEQGDLSTLWAVDEQGDPHWMDIYLDMWNHFVPEYV